MSIMTVSGIVDESDLGVIAPHEHVFIDIRNQYHSHSFFL
ncbi:unnamed protein product [marine sediment metagenome]|uniref:Phosphotriesterase-related protein n=1 Tax=marine sediment metagenome TaxID=412755 RepID=X1MUZ3_9ZZZZ